MKARTIAATVLALSLAGAVVTCAGTVGKTANAQVYEETLIGDASAAAGTEIRFGGGIPTKLGWLHQYTFGSADAQATTFSRETEEDRTTYSQDLYLSVDSCAIKGEILPLLQELAAENADDALRTESTVQKAALAAEFFTADAVQKMQDLHDRLPADETTAETIKMNELLRYYPLSGALIDEKGNSKNFEMGTGIFFPHRAAAASAWVDLNRYFRIPILKNESMGYRVTRYPQAQNDLYLKPDGWNSLVSGPESDHFNFDTISCRTDDAVYFTFDPHTEKGELVDLSKIPGGYGIYRLPYDREQEIFLSEKLEMIYALDPDRRYVGLTASPDGRKLLLQRQEKIPLEPGSAEWKGLVRTPEPAHTYEEAILTAETIDLASRKAEETQEVLRGLDAVSFRSGRDYLVFSDGVSRLCVLTYEDGRYRKALSLEDLPKVPCYSTDCDEEQMDYDGERLVLTELSSVQTTEPVVYGWYGSVSGGADVAVYNADGLAYFGRLYSDLQEWTDDRDFTNWMEQIKPGKQDMKNYYSEDSRNLTEAYVSWLTVRFTQDADAR